MKGIKRYLIYAIQYWVENNSSDKFEKTLFKADEKDGAITIYFWNFETCAEPTENQINNILSNNTLDIAKYKQKDLIKRSYNIKFEKGNGLVTSVLDGSSNPIKVDCSRCDEQNVRGLLDSMTYDLETEASFRDYYNTLQTLTKSEIETIHKEILNYKHSLYSNKITKENSIDAATTIEDIEAITF